MSLLFQCRVVRSRQCKARSGHDLLRRSEQQPGLFINFLTASATARQRVWRSNNSPLRAFTALGPLSLLPHRFTQGAANVNVDTGHKYRCQYRDALYTKPMGHKSVSSLDDSTVSARELPLDSNWSHLQKTRSIDTVVFEHVVQRQRSLSCVATQVPLLHRPFAPSPRQQQPAPGMVQNTPAPALHRSLS